MQCMDCGDPGFKTHAGWLQSQWVAERNCFDYFGALPVDAVPYNDNVTERLAKIRREYYASKFTVGREEWFDWYTKYLNSQAWIDLRHRVLKRDNFICLGCGAPAEQVHHITYRDVGNEQLDQLVSVCRGCHETIHGQR